MKKKPDKKKEHSTDTFGHTEGSCNTVLGTLGIASDLAAASTYRSAEDSLKHSVAGIASALGYGVSSCPSTPYINSYNDVYIDGISLKYVLNKLMETLETKTDVLPKTNLDVIKQFNSEQMAHFILHDVRKCLTGAGDNLTELIEYLNSEPEI